ncbi:hypothetical protein BTO32_12460 [Marinobacter lutaoensis]|uniref:Uncharacterized protein n=1 Tax=Marinobacter lutaoensis TaxID=135739 RepID=A0A1V2DSS8_9GAMM|nr:LysR family transcriptional regulator [Marinobacter lutaoensis]ONF43476.1 hypothetical protein BTO32_12460 [Marinobacter lutaoensis]
MPDTRIPQPRLRLKVGNEVAMGPGKAQLLALIDQHRSISAAARAMGLSYRRAWLLVETMNRCAVSPLVMTATGGRRGGGAQLSALGQDTLARYRRLEQRLLELPEFELLASAFHNAPDTDT